MNNHIELKHEIEILKVQLRTMAHYVVQLEQGNIQLQQMYKDLEEKFHGKKEHAAEALKKATGDKNV